MPSEQEELKLIVTLVDNASPGLEKIVDLNKQLGGTEVRQAHAKMSEGTKELSKAVGQIVGGFDDAFKSLGMFRLGVAGAGAGILLFGMEVSKQIGELGKWAAELRGIGQAARAIGVDPARMKGLIEQFSAVGVEAGDAKAAIAKLADGLADLDRVDSKIRREFMRHVRTPEAAAAAQQFLGHMRDLAHSGQVEEAMKELNVRANNIIANAMVAGASRIEATKRAKEALGGLWNEDMLKLGTDIKEMSADELKIQNERIATAEKYATTLGKIHNEWNDIVEAFKAPLLDALLPQAERLLEIFKSIHAWTDEKTKESKRTEELNKVLPEESPGITGLFGGPSWKAWRDRLAQREYYKQHPEVAIPGSAKEAEDLARRKLEEENTEEMRKLRESTDSLRNQLKENPFSYAPMSYTGSGLDRSMIHNAAFVTGGGATPPGYARPGYVPSPYDGGPRGGPPMTPPPYPGFRGAGPGGPAALNDEKGRPIDPETMRQAEELGRAGDTAGLQRLFASKGYHMSGPACGAVASAYVRSAGFKPPAGASVATNWHGWGEKMEPSGINAPGHPFGSMVGTYWHGTYGSAIGRMLGPGQQGGHVMTIVPGTYDPKTNTAMFADQHGSGVRRRSLNDIDLRYAGDAAIAALKGGGAAGVAGGKIEGGRYPSEAELADKSRAAGERFNNPFNMWFDRYAAEQGGLPGRQITQYDTPSIFPSKMAGAAAAIRKMAQSPLYSGKTMQDLIGTWVGHGQSYAPIIEKMTGISRNTRITPEFLASDDGLKFLMAMSRYETHVQSPYPLTEDQWKKARDVALGLKTDQPGGAGGANIVDMNEARKRIGLPPVSRVEGSASLKVHVNAPKGTAVDAAAEGLFKKVEINRQTQMERAKGGPEIMSL
jgi:hypothetical protein